MHLTPRAQPEPPLPAGPHPGRPDAARAAWPDGAEVAWPVPVPGPRLAPSGMAAGRWLGVGASTDPDPVRAGEYAALRALGGRTPVLLVVFCAGTDEPAAVLAGVRSAAGEVPLIGCSAEAIICDGGPSRRGVTILALGGPGFSVATGAGLDVSLRQRRAGAQVAACHAELRDRPYQVLVLLGDGLAAGHDAVLAGVYEVVGARVPLVGGLAGADPDTRRTFQLHGDAVLADSIVGVAIGSDAPMGVGLRHGWRKIGEPMIVTRSLNGEVRTLDDEPAVDAYLRRLGAPAAAYTDPVAFADFAQTRPLGIRRRSGEEVRNVSSPARLDQRWLLATADVPEGGLVWPMEGDPTSVLAAAAEAAQDAVGGLSGYPPLGMLVFDCVSRAHLLGADGMRAELDAMTRMCGPAPVTGLYSWGEIARTRGVNGFHNHTLAVLALA